jgi:hypothetical protein
MSGTPGTDSGPLVGLFAEMGHLMPTILTGGAFVLSAITLNYPMFMLGVSSVEASLIFVLLRYISDYAITPKLGVMSPADVQNRSPQCSSFFRSSSTARYRAEMENGIKGAFPNYIIFYIVFAVMYCIQALMFYSKECTAMGPKYSNRAYTSIIAGSLFVLLYVIYFLMFGCVSFLNILVSAIFGATFGYLICNQNVRFFGKDSVNILNIASLKERKGMDYVCVTTKATGDTTRNIVRSGDTATTNEDDYIAYTRDE